MQQHLLLKTQQMDTLLEMVQLLNQKVVKESPEQLIRIFELALRAYFGLKKVCFLLKTHHQWQCPIIYGYEPNCIQILDWIHNHSNILELQTYLQAEECWGIPNKEEAKALIFITQEENDVQIRASNTTFVKTLFNVLLSKLELKQLIEHQIAQESINRELRMAGSIQRNILPKKLPNHEHLAITAYSQPHFQVGGDFYDVIELNPQEYFLIIADVSGKGVAAALMMANLQSSLRSFISSQTSLMNIVKRLNELIADLSAHEKFLTLFIAKINLAKKELYYINCGHTPSILKSGRKIKVLDKGTTILGMFPDIKIQAGREKITPNTLLVLYTDGITEATNPTHEYYDVDRLLNTIGQFPTDTNAENAKLLILKDLQEFQQGTPPNDDATLLICKFS